MTMILQRAVVYVFLATICFVAPAHAEEMKANYILFKNVNVFDGISTANLR